jgi:hypothetical protein
MHSIKPIVALCLLLHAELREEKAIGLLNQIQSMLFAIEADQVAMAPKNNDLTAEIAVLKSRLLKLEAARKLVQST